MHQRALAKMTPQIIIIKAPTWRGNTFREVKNVMLQSDIIGLVIYTVNYACYVTTKKLGLIHYSAFSAAKAM